MMWTLREEDGLVEGELTRHYFKCPFCPHGYADLNTHKCSVCKARVYKILWGPPEILMSPELMMIERSYK